MSTVGPEELAAFADGELDEPRRGEVAAAIAADPALAEQVRAHKALRDRLSAHFAPILDAPLPDGLVAQLGEAETNVVDFTAASQRRSARSYLRWGWVAGPALAASLALAVFLRPGDAPNPYAGAQLAAALDGQLVASQGADAPVKVLLSFKDKEGAYCRAFSSEAESGIACRDSEGWQLQAVGDGGEGQTSEYRMAGSDAAEIMERAQAMAVGDALDAKAEEDARAKGWR